ncbi:nucleotide-binding universal stress UspA family protein [Dysgonomonas hofstadii]|uniref:Nucleotide-binding universal stress UspA family protein n=1 Tax=Dysgonomonas hofstadii TaxID=637886 RepID=A0A840CTL8_9BACT|nr:universal stress protein [Dysgonomonas hofstadii]MBB4037034.1 nucleotide-binding universal stress UspA family protein [Dysgonomonas hofstadii]
MEDKLITVAIHTAPKAKILQKTLEERGIATQLIDISDYDSSTPGFAVRIKESDLTRALGIIEGIGLFRYDNEQTIKIDDGRKRVLVAIDFSEYSLKACKAAFTVAHQMNAKVKILHVYRIHYPITFPFADMAVEDKDTNMLDTARRRMLDFCNEIDRKITQKEFPSINYSYSLREGNVEEEIEAFVEEYKPFLLVLGSKGESNNKSNYLGSVTADIIEMTNVPVMAVPENSNLQNPEDVKHIAFLTNLQEKDLESFDNLVNILKPFPQVRVTLLHINVKNRTGDKWTETELLGMKEYFSKKYPELNVGYDVLDSADPVEAINYYIESEEVNILALNTRRRNLFGRIFMPSISRKVLVNTNVTLVVFRG